MPFSKSRISNKVKNRLGRTGHFISSRIGKAIGDYKLIENGDKILVALSGGKDSFTLLSLLRERQKWSPAKYELIACHVKSDSPSKGRRRVERIKRLCHDMGVRFILKKIELSSKEKKKPSCFWCAWNRRKTLFETAAALGCNKVALGHHKDDIIETTLLNLLFQGEFSSMNTRQELFQGKIVIIRPLCYIEERLTKKYAKEKNFPLELCKCPFSSDSKRKYVKDLISAAQRKSPNVKTNILKSISRVKHAYLNP